MTPERAAETDAERTEWIPVTDDRPTGPQGPPPRGRGAHEAGDDSSGGRRRPLLIGAAVVGLLAVLYVGDLLISSTDVPRGVAVAGVEIGGMGKPEAEQELNAQLAGRLTQPVTLQAGSSTATIDPRAAGLELDVEGTIARAGEQPFNPWTRLTSLFGTRDVAPVTRVNGFALGQALDGARPQLDRPATEGTIRFENLEPVAVPSVPGQVVDGAGAAQDRHRALARPGAGRPPDRRGPGDGDARRDPGGARHRRPPRRRRPADRRRRREERDGHQPRDHHLPDLPSRRAGRPHARRRRAGRDRGRRAAARDHRDRAARRHPRVRRDDGERRAGRRRPRDRVAADLRGHRRGAAPPGRRDHPADLQPAADDARGGPGLPAARDRPRDQRRLHDDAAAR